MEFMCGKQIAHDGDGGVAYNLISIDLYIIFKNNVANYLSRNYYFVNNY